MVQTGATRRQFLIKGAALGCSAAASPFLTPVSLASAPWDQRLVVIILRGGMDGLGVVQPYGDPDFQALRSGAGASDRPSGAHDLNGFFALHPGLGDLMPLWNAGELSFAHAVATPYRDKRSHFDGQDLLEAGTGFSDSQPGAGDGWLNRMMQVVPGVEAETAYAIGREDLLVLRGDAPVANWMPGTELMLSPQAEALLAQMYRRDPLFESAMTEASDLSERIVEAAARQLAAEGEEMLSRMDTKLSGARRNLVNVAEFAAARLRQDTRIAAFSINGWDTHQNQERALTGALGRLAETILALRSGLGPVWRQTAVLAMTEFGRTARQNGTRGTDHGTGGAMLLAGGAIRGGAVLTKWPGLAEADLYDRRDLMPTMDVRSIAGATMQGLFGIDRSALERVVFPGLDMSDAPPVTL